MITFNHALEALAGLTVLLGLGGAAHCYWAARREQRRWHAVVQTLQTLLDQRGNTPHAQELRGWLRTTAAAALATADGVDWPSALAAHVRQSWIWTPYFDEELAAYKQFCNQLADELTAELLHMRTS